MSIFNIKNTPICIKTEINNGLLKSQNAMPQKDSTSDAQNSFSMDRQAYVNSWTNNPTNTKQNYPSYGMERRRGLPTVFDGTHSAVQKKWKSNRDASEIVRKNRVLSVGLGTINANGQSLSFESHANANTINSALNRVRGGGSVAPPKKAFNTNNAYGPSPKNIPLVPALKIKDGYKMPPTKYAGAQSSKMNWLYKKQFMRKL